MNLPGFADGGRPEINTVSLVGERGPELFVPDTAGTIFSNEQSRAAMARFSPANGATNASISSATADGSTGAGGIPAMNFSFNTIRIADQDYVSKEQLQQAMVTAAKSGAVQGEAQTLRRLRMSPGTRRKMGL